ncbi:MAG TPA: serine/threonine-protein kinase, partial [Polyangiaceae bacterium]|nr:serine/threonine-protein kinase [Polyangiaceae bacterium]
HEARLGAMLTHRNIVRIFDLVEEPDGALVLVMELLRGETLRRHLKNKGPLPADEAISIMLPVLSALEHAHEMGIIHRDIKPANIFLAIDPDGQVTPKLLDFGIAKIPQGGVQTLDGRVLGTPRYMSPEQIRSESTIDGRSDIFGMGAVLVEMLTGQSPFFAETPSASLASVLETQLDPDPRIEPRLWLVLQRALAKRPYERYAHCAEFAQSLRDAVGVADHALFANLRRSKPPPRISSTVSILRPDEFGVGAARSGDEHSSRGPGGEARREEEDADDDSLDDDSSDYAIDVVSTQSESAGSEPLSGHRPSNGTPMRGIVRGDGATTHAGVPHHPHVRITRGRVLAFGVSVIFILGLVFCGGLYFREAADRVNPKASAAASVLMAPVMPPTSAMEQEQASPAEDVTPASLDAPAVSSGPGRRDPPPAHSAVPAGRKKKVALTPGF